MKAPRFEIYKSDKDGQYYFRLRAKNARIILASEGYTQKHNAEGGIEAVRGYSAAIPIESWSLWWIGEVVSYYGFSIIASNGEIIGRSETYTTKAGAKKGIASVRRCAPIAEIVDLTGEI